MSQVPISSPAGLVDRLPGPVNAAIVVALGYLGAVLTWQLVPQAQTPTPAERPTAVSAAPVQQRAAVGSQIAARHLFGQADVAKPAQPVAQQTEAPDTRLNLKLLGVLAATPAEGAMAIVADARNQEQVYAVGETLPGEAVLEEVYPDRIILRRAERLETLRLPENSASLGAPAAGGADQRAGNLPVVAPNVLSDGTSVRDLRDQIVKNPLSFARRVATIPVRENGKLVGYRLRARDGSKTLEELGVQPDDVVTEVNGFRLDTRRGGMEALKNLRTASSINLTLRRNGAEIPVSLSLQ